MKNKVIWIVLLVSIFGLTSAVYAIDTDNDGLDDLVESNTGVYVDQFDTGTDPLNPDTDFDGVNDGPEVNLGAHPLNPTITPSAWKIGNEIKISNYGFDFSMVWAGSEYGVSWYDWPTGIPEIYFGRMGASGNKIGTDLKITNNTQYSPRKEPSLVWTGLEYGVSWADRRDGNYEIYFARINATGNKIGSDVRITNAAGDSLYPSLVWMGSEYGVAWSDGRDGNIYFARISAIGNKIGSDVGITNAGMSSNPSLVWTGSEYGVIWEDGRDGNSEIYFARIGADGTKIGTDMRIRYDGNESIAPSLVWNGSEYGMGWSDGRSDLKAEIYFARVSDSGAKLSSDIRITFDEQYTGGLSLVWTGNEYGISWMTGPPPMLACDPPTCYIYPSYFIQLDTFGNKVGQGIIIEDDASQGPFLVWNGTEYAVSWTRWDGRFLVRIGIDADGDGLSNSEELTYGLNPNNYDTDGDGLTDGDEVNLYLTDPSNPDTDNGGKPDGQEVAEGTDPLDASDDVEGSPAPNQNRIKPRINGFDGCNMTFNNNTRGFGANASKIIFLTVPLFMILIKKRFNRLSRRKGGGSI